MKHRVAELVGPVAEKMWVSTFHSACVRILRRDAAAPRLPVVVHDLRPGRRRSASPATSSATSASTPRSSRPGRCTPASRRPRTTTSGPIEYRERAKTIFERKISDVFTEYQARLLKAGAMDFDDLLVNTVELFRQFPEVLEQLPAPVPPRARRRVPGHQPGAERARPDAHRPERRRLRRRRRRPVPARPARWCRTPGGEVPIEQLRAGDEVLGTDGGQALAAGRVREVMPGQLLGLDRRGPCRRSCAPGHAPPHRPGPHDPRPRPLARVPHVPCRPRLADRPDEERPVGLARAARRRLPGAREPGARRRDLGAEGL